MIDEITKQIKPLINGKLIYLSQYGSHLYGLNTENSDLDFRGVYIPNLDDVILHKDKDEINEELEIYLPQEPLQQKEHILGEIYMEPIVSEKGKQINGNRDNLKKVDVKIFSLQKFIQLCSKADTNALDLLFSMDSKHVPYYLPEHKDTDKEFWSIMRRIHLNRDKLINTDRLESPITYALKQASKYSIKGNYVTLLDKLIQVSKELYDNGTCAYIEDLIPYLQNRLLVDGQMVSIDIIANKGKPTKYLRVLGVQHQTNLSISIFLDRLQSKLDTYSSRSLVACRDGGNDWKALSHALRILFEVKELMETGNIVFPCKQKEFLLRVKNGQVSREEVDSLFEEELSNVLATVKGNKLNWKYRENFWEKFIVKEYRNVN